MDEQAHRADTAVRGLLHAVSLCFVSCHVTRCASHPDKKETPHGQELLGSGVTVTALCPGVTATGMLSTAAEANAQLGKLPSFLIGDVDEVAVAGKVIEVPGAMNLAATLAAKATPKWLLRRVAGTVTRKAM